MESHGIRILDKEINNTSVDLKNFLEEIDDIKLNWSILYFYGSGNLKKWGSIQDFSKATNKSENGLFVGGKDLKELASLFKEIIDILIIGCKDINFLHRYEDDENMYKSCDVVIEKFDSCFWEVFSKDSNLIQKLSNKFKNIEFLEPNFLK